MLDLDLDPALPDDLRAELERAARVLGLPLAQVEEAGRSEATCLAFLSTLPAGAGRAAPRALPPPGPWPSRAARRLARP